MWEGEGSRLLPLPIVPRAPLVFPLLLFLLGYPAGASAEERAVREKGNRQHGRGPELVPLTDPWMEKDQPRSRSSRNFGISDNGLALNCTGPRPVRVIGVRGEGLEPSETDRLTPHPRIRDHRWRLGTRLELAQIRGTSTARLTQ